VATPKGRLNKLEKDRLDKPWQQARAGVEVKLLPQGGELYVLARSADRVAKERAMRQKQLKRLWKRLKQLQGMKLGGAARRQSPIAWRLVEVQIDAEAD
jgi:hypothetical protein